MKNLKSLAIIFMLFCFKANANLGADLNLDKKDLTPAQQEAKKMGEVFCEYCELGSVEEVYQEELYGYNMYGKKLSSDEFKETYQGFIDNVYRISNEEKKKPSLFSQSILSCKSQSLKCLGDSVIKFKDKTKSYPDNISNKKLAEIQMPKYCFETYKSFGVKNLIQKDCDRDAKEIEQLLKNDQKTMHSAYIVTNCENIYQTVNGMIYFKTPEEKQKYIDLMGYCAKQVGDYLRSQGAVI